MCPENSTRVFLLALLAGISLAAPLGAGDAPNKPRLVFAPGSNIYTLAQTKTTPTQQPGQIITITSGSIPGWTPIMSTSEDVTATTEPEVFPAPTSTKDEEDPTSYEPTGPTPSEVTLSLSTRPAPPSTPATGSSSSKTSTTTNTIPPGLPITFSIIPGPGHPGGLHARQPQATPSSAASETSSCTSGCIVFMTSIEGPSTITVAEGGATLEPTNTEFDHIPSSEFVTLSLSIVPAKSTAMEDTEATPTP